MGLSYPIICKKCHKNLTVCYDEICDECFVSGHKNIICPVCDEILEKKVFLVFGARVMYHRCKICETVVIDKESVNKILSISDIKKIIGH